VNPEVLVVGTGAMACMFAGRFSAAGIECCMLGSWQEGVAALAKNGIRLISEDGSERISRVKVSSEPRVFSGTRMVMVLVKSYQTERVADQLAGIMDERGLALTLQNGLGNYEVLSQKLGTPRVALGSTTAGAHLIAPGVVKLAGEGVITLGTHIHLKPFFELFGRSGFIVESEANLNSILWGKLVINCAINPLTALLRVANGVLLERPSARALMASAAREVAAVAAAKGIQLPFPDPVVAVETIARKTAFNYSSMLQDIRRGGRTEVNNFCGMIVQEGEKLGIQTPTNLVLLQLIQALEKEGI